jgi:D-alanyl-D-alanine carboxypeptidase
MKSIVLFALTFFIFQSSIIAQPTGDYKKLDTYLSTLYEKDKMLGSVAVMENGQIVFQKAYGTFDPNTLDDFSVNPETVYRIGSITKTFTATMILQLVEAGKLSLDTKLNTFFPDVCNAGSITIKNMLQHRSGIFNFTDDPVFLGYMREGRSKEEMLEVFNNLDCDFEPGTQTAYSNTGFVLLGYIIEQ